MTYYVSSGTLNLTKLKLKLTEYFYTVSAAAREHYWATVRVSEEQ